MRRDKKAILNNWPHIASCEINRISQWWQEYPEASIGIVCGESSGIWVLDIDLPDGPKNLANLEKIHGSLPETLIQKTGSGGLQYFFKWNGVQIRNTSSKIAKNIDSRGEGGYVVVPPSPHPSGNQYEWVHRSEIAYAPKWLTGLITQQKKIIQTNTYGQTALSNELANLGQAAVGQRNDVLNQAAFSLGQLVAGGELDHVAVESALVGVALSIGLKEQETRRTIQSGMMAGALEPRKGDHNNDFGSLSESEVDNVIKCNQVKSGETTGNQNVINLKSSCNHSEIISGYSLAERISDWVCNSPGSFTNKDVDDEFCLKTRQEKVNRAVILRRLYMARKIKKDKRRKSVWHVVDQDIDFIDLTEEEPTSFHIKLPFGLHKFVKIPPKAIMLLAGSSNAGKTAFLLNTLKMNLGSEYEKLYLMSEMGGGEYRTRIQAFGDGLEPWKKVRAASKSYDFDGAISHHNPNGLTCIDYLEEVDGEYYKIPTDIRNIYDSLGDGVAFIAIQKRTDHDFARGGQGTVEKARLVMNLDYLATGDHCIICSLKLAKVKHFLERNLQNHEIHFKLEMGCQMTPITDWMLSPRVNRKKYIAQYEAGNDNPDGTDLFFKMDNGENKRIIARDINKWQESYPNIDVYNELSIIAGESVKSKFLTSKGYFWQLSGILKKKNDELDKMP